MDALDCIMSRRSIRRFLERKIDEETALTVVEAGARAPSSGNVQDWKFIIIDETGAIKKIADCCLDQECVHNAPMLIVVCSDSELCTRHYGLRGEKLYTVQNCAAACENMLLAAHALGLGAVWVGAFEENKLKTELSIPDSVRPQAIISIGYPDEHPDEKHIKDLTTITFFGKYGQKLKNPHRVLRDYSVEWAKIGSNLSSKVNKSAKKGSKSFADMFVKSKGAMQKYTERFKKSK